MLEMLRGASDHDHGGRGAARPEIALALMQAAHLRDRGGQRGAEPDARILGVRQQPGRKSMGVPGDGVAAAGAKTRGHSGAVEHHGDLAEHSPGVLIRAGDGGSCEQCGVHAATVGGDQRKPDAIRP